MGTYRLHVQLNRADPQDRIIIAALDRLGDRGKSRWVRQVLFDAVTGPARSEILDEIRAVREAVEHMGLKGLVKQQCDRDDGHEPEEAARNLDGLLGRLEAW